MIDAIHKCAHPLLHRDFTLVPYYWVCPQCGSIFSVEDPEWDRWMKDQCSTVMMEIKP